MCGKPSTRFRDGSTAGSIQIFGLGVELVRSNNPHFIKNGDIKWEYQAIQSRDMNLLLFRGGDVKQEVMQEINVYLSIK
jgi:hypothetical protein